MFKTLTKDWQENPLIILMYTFEQPETLTLNEEYLVTTVSSLLGEIGGALSMVMGFSFIELATLILNFVKMIIYKISAKSKKVSCIVEFFFHSHCVFREMLQTEYCRHFFQMP